jgi:hypothetical protein
LEKLKKLEKEISEREEAEAFREKVEIPLFDCARRPSYNLIRKEDS